MASVELGPGGPADPSPQQRRLAGLIATHGPEEFRTWVSVRVPTAGVDASALATAASPVLRRLLDETGATGPAPDPGGEEHELPAAVRWSLRDQRLDLDLPATAADGATTLAVLAEIVGAGAGPDPAALPYSAAARWWNEVSRADSAGGVREFWRERAVGWSTPVPSVLAHPADRRGPVRCAGGDRLGRELVGRLREQDRAPVSAWLLAGWQVLLRRHIGGAAPACGVATDLRRHPELAGCRGPLTAHLPARAEDSPTAPLAAYAAFAAAQVEEGASRAEWFDWEYALPDRAAATRSLGFGFAYQTLPGVWDTPAGAAQVESLYHRGDRFALRLVCEDGPEGLRIWVEHDPARVAAEVAADLVAELPVLLADGLAQSGPATRLSIVRGNHADRALARGTGEAVAVPDRGLPGLLRDVAARFPSRTAVRDAHHSLTYQRLADRMDELAGALRERGARPEEPVAVWLEPGVDLLVALLAVQASGACYLYLPPEQPLRRSALLVADARAGLVVTPPGAEASALGVAAVPVDSSAPTGPAREPPPDCLVYVCYTSGESGRPKQVQISHRGLLNYLWGVAPMWPDAPRSLAVTTAAFDLALPSLYLPLLTGGSVTFGPTDIPALCDELQARRYELVRLTPSLLREVHAELAVRRKAGEPATTSSGMLVGGETLPAALVRDHTRDAPESKLVVTYGPVDTAGARICGRADTAPPGPTGAAPLGSPVINTGLRVLDPDGQLVPTGATGELFIGGTGLARGYGGRPGGTAERFVPDPFGAPGRRMYRTGDLARWLPGGRLELLGRVDGQAGVSDPGGEVDQSAGPDPDPGRPHPSARYEPPRNDVEETLVEIWAETLGVERVGIHDNFFAIGGDSILSILIASRAAKRGLRLSLRDFFDRQTIAAMASSVERLRPEASAPEASAPERVPGLTPAQHWFFAQQHPHPGHWNQGWLLSVDGADFRADTLAAALAAVVRHHPALHTVFTRDPDVPGGWRPRRSPSGAGVPELREVPVTGPDWAAGVYAALAELQEADLTSGPLLRAALLVGDRPERRRLALVAHHLVIDIVSWQILFDDLRTAYRLIRQGEPVALAAATMPPDEWAALLSGQVAAARADLGFWLAQSPADHPPLPTDRPAGPARERDRQVVDVALDPDRTGILLRRVSAELPVDHVITTAVARAFAQWSGIPEVHLTMEGQGRVQRLVDADLHRSVGWFTSLYPLLVRSPREGDPLVALREVSAQLAAVSHDGLTYGVLRHLDPVNGPALADRPVPQITVNFVGRTGGSAGTSHESAAGAELRLAPAPEPAPPLLHPSAPRQRLWVLDAVVRDDKLRLLVDYAGRHYRAETARHLADSVLAHLGDLVDAWLAGGTGVPALAGPGLLDEREQRAALAQALARAPERSVPE